MLNVTDKELVTGLNLTGKEFVTGFNLTDKELFIKQDYTETRKYKYLISCKGQSRQLFTADLWYQYSIEFITCSAPQQITGVVLVGKTSENESILLC